MRETKWNLFFGDESIFIYESDDDDDGRRKEDMNQKILSLS